MKVPKFLDDAIQYVSGAMSRIFGPTDDQYPETGVTPFEGDPNRKHSRRRD
ncbi:MAG: hypothetical protein ACKO24_02355 [Leptolyngbyaceae cyanobacterium]